MKLYDYPLYRDFPQCGDLQSLIRVFQVRYGDIPALSYRNKPSDTEPVNVSYRAFAADVLALANACHKHGMTGAHCAVIGGASYDWICLYYALQCVGAVMVPLDREWQEADLASTTAFAECSVVFYDANLKDKMGSVVPDGKKYVMRGHGEGSVAALREEGAGSTEFPVAVDPEKMSLLVFTSGTTGKGKGVMLTQRAVLDDVTGGLYLIRPSGKSILTLPPHHTYGSSVGFLALMIMGMEVYLSSGIKYLSKELLSEKPDLLVAVPLFLESFWKRIENGLNANGKNKTVERAIRVTGALRRVRIDLRPVLFRQVLAAFGGNLKMIASGGAPLRPELVRGFESFGIAVFNGYGITECAPLIASNRNRFFTSDTVGYPIPGLSLKIDSPDENGNGEICVKGSNVMLGYYRDPEATAAVFDDEGYFRTGDIGHTDERGRLVISGRSKNLIILANGKNVYPEEIETALSAVPGVADVVVYEGVSRRGSEHNRIVAEIYPDPVFAADRTKEELFAYFREHTDAYNRTAVPYKKVELVRVRTHEFPKNTLRKIMRFRLDTSID